MKGLKIFLILELFIVILSCNLIFSQAEEQSEEASKVFNPIKEGVVSFVSYDEKGKQLYQGIGFALNEEIIATNYHLISQAREIKGVNFKGKKAKFEGIVDVNKKLDLALLKIKRNLTPLSLGTLKEFQKGTKFYVVGGDPSGKFRVLEGEVKGVIGLTSDTNIVETDVVIPEGYAGAPLVDSKGVVVGMMFYLEGGTVFALPANKLQSLSTRGRVQSLEKRDSEDYFSTYEGAYFSGRVYNLFEDNLNAQKALERVVEKKPENEEALSLLASVYTKQRKYSSAVSTYEKIVKIEPQRDDIFMRIGQIYLKMMEWEKAVPPLKKAVELNIDNKEAYYDIGNAYEKMEKFDLAAKAYEKYLDLNPEDIGNTYFRLGICYSELEQFEKAIPALQKSLEDNPQNKQALTNLVRAYRQTNQPDKAAEQYIKMAEIYPDDAAVYYNNAIRVYDEANMPNKAIKVAEKLVQLKPKDDQALYNLGYMYVKAKNYQGAIDTLKKVVNLRPDHEYAHYNLGVSYLRLKKYNEAINSFKKFVEIAPDNANGWFNIGVAYMQQKKFSEAVEPLKKTIQIDPNMGVAYYNLAIAYLNLRDNQSAREMYEKLKTINSNLAQKLEKYLK